MNRLLSLALLGLLAACSSPTTTPTPAPVVATVHAPAVTPVAGAGHRPSDGEPAAQKRFGFDRVAESCGSFLAHITNAERTAWLDVSVDVKGQNLQPGAHALAVGAPGIELTITELDVGYEGEWGCTDIGGGPRTPVTRRWKAVSGKLHVRLHLPAPNATSAPYEGAYDRADVRLEGVRFVDEEGHAAVVDVAFTALRIGWLPG